MSRDVVDLAGTEGDRLERIGQLAEESGTDWAEGFRPGSFGCHELLDRTSILAAQLDEQILSHPSCLLEPEWFALAEKACSALNDLYQRIGALHLGNESRSD